MLSLILVVYATSKEYRKLSKNLRCESVHNRFYRNNNVRIMYDIIFCCDSDFKGGSYWSISSSSNKFGAQKEEFGSPFQVSTRTWENDAQLVMGNIYEGQDPLKRLKNVYGSSNGVGSSSSIDLEWETAEGI